MTDIELTQEELSKLSKAMKQPEFAKLLNEYVDEISDPKNKAEYDAYLKQLENAGDLPPGRTLLRAAPNLCIRTSVKNAHKRTMKLFINLCETDRLPAPKLDRTGKGGNWQLPYAMGQPRHDKDNKGGVCLTMDCAFHATSFQIAQNSSKFLSLMCDTACEAADTLLKEQAEKVSKDYKLMRNLRCKGGAPGTIIVSEARLADPSLPRQPKAEEKRFKLSEEGPSLYKELITTQRKYKEQAQEPIVEEEEEQSTEAPQTKPVGIVKPAHKVIHSSPVNMTDCLDTRVRNVPRPQELIVVIEVPFLETLSDARIDIKDNLIVFEVENVYYLEVKLFLPVLEERASAKFDRKKKELRVVLPVKQLPVVGPEFISQAAQGLEYEVPEEVLDEEQTLEEPGLVEELVVGTLNEEEERVCEQHIVEEPEEEQVEEEQVEEEQVEEEQVEVQSEDTAKKNSFTPCCIQLKSSMLMQLI